MTEQQGRVEIKRIYIRDLSFESPNAVEGTGTEWKPEVNLNINFSSTVLQDELHEVRLRCTITCRNNKKTAYVIEVEQAGDFVVTGLQGEQVKAVLGTFCPNTLFPYVRETVDSLLIRGGFPPLTLTPINFDQLYADSRKAKQDEDDDPPPEQRVTH